MDKKKLMKATWPIHQKVENMPFPKQMFQGKITKKTYHTFIYNEYCCINELEKIGKEKNLFDGLEDVPFATRILNDVSDIEEKSWKREKLESTKEYIDYINSEIKNDDMKIMAHIYVRHCAAMAGGQMIKTKVPGKATMFDFPCDTKITRDRIRDKVCDSVINEVAKCFEFAGKTFEDMEKHID